MICVHRMTTRATQKLSLGLAILFLAMPAHTTDATGVAWVDQDDGHPGPPSLVFDEAAKLKETPTVVPCALRFPYRNPVTNAGKVFQGNRSIRVLGFLNEPFTDLVVDVTPKTPLPTRELFQPTFCGVSTYRL